MVPSSFSPPVLSYCLPVPFLELFFFLLFWLLIPYVSCVSFVLSPCAIYWVSSINTLYCAMVSSTIAIFKSMAAMYPSSCSTSASNIPYSSFSFFLQSLILLHPLNMLYIPSPMWQAFVIYFHTTSFLSCSIQFWYSS